MRRRTGRPPPAPCVWTSTSVHTAVSPAATSSASRVSARSPRTGPQTPPALCAAPSSHTPASTKVSVRHCSFAHRLRLNFACSSVESLKIFCFLFAVPIRAQPDGKDFLPKSLRRSQAELPERVVCKMASAQLPETLLVLLG